MCARARAKKNSKNNKEWYRAVVGFLKQAYIYVNQKRNKKRVHLGIIVKAYLL